MENNQNRKIGGGILTVSIIQMVFSALGLFFMIVFLVFKDAIEEFIASSGQVVPNTPVDAMVISIVFMLVILAGIILIMAKNVIGVYLYFGGTIISLLYTAVTSGLHPNMLLSLILPVLMGIFVYQKRELYGSGNNTEFDN